MSKTNPELSKSARIALFFSRPGWLMVTAVLGTLIAAAYSQEARLTRYQAVMSAFISLGTGVPALVCTKRLIRRNIDDYAEFSMGFASGEERRKSWRKHRKSAMAVTPIPLAIGVSALIARYFHLPYMPILGMMVILSILGYPEQEEVYYAMQDKLAQADEEQSEQ
jgi:hypothetical protein